MKRIRAILSAAAILTVSSAGTMPVSGLEYCETLTYIVSENETIITGFCGNPEVLNLPSRIENKPVTEIRENAFYKCDTLKKIKIPESVRKIGHHAFFQCDALEEISIKGEISRLSEGIFYGCESLEKVELKSINYIDDYAFYECRSLKKFPIPQKVSEIGDYAFYNCISLSETMLNNKLLKLGDYAFYNCPALTGINLPESLISAGQYAVGFGDRGSTENFTIIGMPDTIAEHYALNNNINFRQRITSERKSNINGKFILSLTGWIFTALLYGSIMIHLIPAIKKHRRRTAFR